MADLSPDSLSEIYDLVSDRQDALIRNLFPSLHPADVADLLDLLDSDARTYLFDLVPEHQRSAVLVELDQRARAELVEDMPEGTLTDLIRPLDSDDAADVLGELEDPVRETVLERLAPDEAQDIRTLLEFAPDTAGGLMATEYVALPEEETVRGAFDAIRELGEALSSLRMVYVSEDDGRLNGVVSLRQLVIAEPETPLRDVVRAPRVIVSVDLDQEAVAERFRQYDAIEAPVVDDDGRMLGVITIDDVVDVIREEVEEDLGRLAGTGDERATDSVLHATGRRLPWLLVGLGGGLAAAWALSRYELSLKAVVSLAFFVPVINAMGGNVAMQSSSIAVRALALGSNVTRAMGRRMWKEFLVSVLNGAACGVLLGVIAGWWLGDQRLALLVGCALFAVILIATTVGALVPLVLHRLRIDPALAAGPFVTTANDVLGIIVYLSLADVLLVQK